MNFKTDEIASTHLGKKFQGAEKYDPALLVAVPRAENRIQYTIDSTNLPFEGCDVWHAYEFSALTENGVPVTRVMKLKYNCDNEFLVESKSLKLYLNSFNMTRIGENVNDCLDICRKTIENDLSRVLQTDVSVKFLDNETERVEIFSEFKNIMNCVDEAYLEIEHFKEAPEVLRAEEMQVCQKHYLMYDCLRSNCRVTHQPDFGDVFIYYKSSKHVDEASLVKYLVSFRSEYHFHEECCEMIYKRLSELLNKDDELMVCALYTRRGGIDICPVRHSRNCNIEDVENLINLNKFARCGIKQ